MAQAYSEIQAADGELVVVAMSDAATAQSTHTSLALPYRLLPDEGRTVIGTLYAVVSAGETPPFATYVVNADGIVTLANVETGGVAMATTQQIIAALGSE